MTTNKPTLLLYALLCLLATVIVALCWCLYIQSAASSNRVDVVQLDKEKKAAVLSSLLHFLKTRRPPNPIFIQATRYVRPDDVSSAFAQVTFISAHAFVRKFIEATDRPMLVTVEVLEDPICIDNKLQVTIGLDDVAYKNDADRHHSFRSLYGYRFSGGKLNMSSYELLNITE